MRLIGLMGLTGPKGLGNLGTHIWVTLLSQQQDNTLSQYLGNTVLVRSCSVDGSLEAVRAFLRFETVGRKGQKCAAGK